MPPFSIIGLFCEDIREEKSGAVTVVGVFTDNLAVPGFPVVMPKFSLYVRINLDPAFDPPPISLRLIMPDDSEVLSSVMESDLVTKSREKALKNGAPIVGLVSKIVTVSLQINQAGRVRAIAKIGDEEFIFAALSIEPAPA